MQNKPIIIQLIWEDIRNKHAVQCLKYLGLDSSIFTINFSNIILQLLELRERPDELYKKYVEMIDNAVGEITFKNFSEKTGHWSVKIYTELLEMKVKES